MKIESEKVLEAKLTSTIKKLGGWSIKLLAIHLNGIPDRLCLLPGGVIFFAEIKTTKKTPKKIQGVIHRKLQALGFKVFVIDSTKDIINSIDSVIN